ncbi:hypothetical protein IV102_34775 [bacterium]|nr:hypothetical protein [bacterium]
MTIVLVLLASVMASHSLVDRLELTTRCRALAEAAVEEAWLKLRLEPGWGTRGDEVVSITFPGDPGDAIGQLCFAGSDASTNNLSGVAARPGWRQQTVPPGCAQLVGVGRCRGVQVLLNVVLKSGQFPYAVACEGPFISTGGTRVSASLEPDQNAPADMACNAPVAEAVQLGPGSWVSGDLRSAGGIVLASQSGVAGQTLPYSAAVPLPEIDLARYDPSLNGSPYQNLPVNLQSEVLTGESRCSSDLSVSGDLRLEGATLYVRGNLTVSGALSGSGLVVVEGNTSVRGSTTLDTSHNAVLLSGGNVSLKGSGAEASSFRGLVYSKGSFSAEQVSMVGTFIARGPLPTRLDACQVVYDPSVTTLHSSDSVTLSWDKFAGVYDQASQDCPPLVDSSQASWGFALGSFIKSAIPTSRNFSLTTEDQERTLTLTLEQQEGGAESSSQALFSLNDFLGQGRPLELLSWRENE